MVMSVNIYKEIGRLLHFGLAKRLIQPEDLDYTKNAILTVLELDEWQETDNESEKLDSPVPILERILDWAAVNGRLEENTVTYRDLLDTQIMGCFVARPSEIVKQFNDIYEQAGPTEATKYLYSLSQESNYIRTDRIAKNEHWYAHTEYGELEITINLSKPEKDPKAIAAAKHLKESNYPNCLLCKENVGYAGRVNHPARQNLRTIPFVMEGETWHLQFSPYVYYHEHAIVFLSEHLPMVISKRTFDRILEFVELLPHYFLGSNADLPIVGGSILSHDHYQGGYHDFPMAKAEIETEFKFEEFPAINAGIVKWPMSVIRLQGQNRQQISELASIILSKWRSYSDEAVGIHAYTEEIPHNTITPIARRNGDLYELDLVLRNNRTSDEHPLGIYHPHEEVHHIKKENIGLIEVMGLAVLPGRLQEELTLLADTLLLDNSSAKILADDRIAKHHEWALKIKAEYPNAVDFDEVLKKEIGKVFSTILEHCGVFKRDSQGQTAFLNFLKTI